MQNLTINETIELLSKVTNKKNSIYPRRLVRDSNMYDKFKIIKFIKSEEYIEYGNKIRYHHYFKVKFIKTGYETIAKLKNINEGSIKDMLYPNVKGVGCLGEEYDEIKNEDRKLFESLYDRWYNILNRCYNKDHKSYPDYGAKGVYVCDRWLNFSKFYKDVQKLNNYNYKMILDKKLTLDKDSLQQNAIKKVYSPDTCIWLTRKQQQSYIDQSAKAVKQFLKFRWEDPNGNTGVAIGIGPFAREHGLNASHIGEVIKGRRNSTHGWKFYPCEE